MRVRIGICLLALCWPLLATAAPGLGHSSPTHACCRRDGAHHCDSPASHPTSTTVAAVCRYSGRQLKVAGPTVARPVAPVRAPQSANAEQLLFASCVIASHGDLPVLSSRGPPLAC